MTSSLRSRAASAGFSLIELLVSMAIGLVVTLVITQVMIDFDGAKRTSTSVNDANQSGAYAAYVLDRAVRNAGTGYAQRWTDFFGCTINAQRSSLDTGPTVLPPAQAFPGAFKNASLTRRLAPVLIEQGQADTPTEVRGDILTVMSGAAGKSEMPQSVAPSAITVTPAVTLGLPNTLEYRSGDLILLADSSLPGCMIQQVGVLPDPKNPANPLPLAGDYLNLTGSTVSLATFATSAGPMAAQLGNVGNKNPPQFQMFAAGDDSTLWSFDLLKTASTTSSDSLQAVADGVIEMRALYGLDTNNDRTVDLWEDADPAHGYDYKTLTDGSPAALTKIHQIVAIRFGLILRSSLLEKKTGAPVTAGPLVLFSDLADTFGKPSLKRTRTLSPLPADDQFYRYRTIEVTVPLRNMIYAP